LKDRETRDITRSHNLLQKKTIFIKGRLESKRAGHKNNSMFDFKKCNGVWDTIKERMKYKLKLKSFVTHHTKRQHFFPC